MQISVVISEVDQPPITGDEAASAVLSALGGNPDEDFCVVSFAPPLELPFGRAGKDPNT